MPYCYCFSINSDKFLLQPSPTNGITGEIYETVDDAITYISKMIEDILFSIKYQNATKDILEFTTATILKLRSRANPDFLDVLKNVGDWRTNETDNFPYNKEAEDVIAASISSMGPEVVLSVLPLNLTGENGGPGRAWLLPLLRDNVRFAELDFTRILFYQILNSSTRKLNSLIIRNLLTARSFKRLLIKFGLYCHISVIYQKI